MEKEELVAEDVIASLGIAASVHRVYVERVSSPWNEKVLVKRRKDHLDVKMVVWRDNAFLYGRIYRLLLYVYDILDPDFGYNSKKVPVEAEQPSERELYTQIWSIYVDRRVQDAAIPNFYSRLLRRNLFLDVRRDLAWKKALALFDALWERNSYAHAEIIDYARNLDTLLGTEGVGIEPDAFEVEIGEFMVGHSVKRHLDKLSSPPLRDMADEILNYTAYNCRGTLIHSSYFGICFEYQGKRFVEIIPARQNLLSVSLQDFRTGLYRTFQVTEASDLRAVQAAISDTFTIMHLDAQSA